MAHRPIFTPDFKGFPFVSEKSLEFEWHAGFAKIQAQKSIASLHEAATRANIEPVLEISSKSIDTLGVSLSAFNLKMNKDRRYISVECAYQGSKIFVNGGPFSDLYFVSSREAKTDDRIRSSGDFLGYEFFGENFTSEPVTAFYDWLYLTALSQNSSLADRLLEFNGFSDIAFNPKKSLNCQARAAALFVALSERGEIKKVLKDRDYYIDLIKNKSSSTSSSVKNTLKANTDLEKSLQLELPL